MSWLVDIDARRITGVTDGATVSTIEDVVGTLVLAAYTGTNLPTYNATDQCVTFNPSNSEALADETLPASINTLFQGNSFFHAIRGKVDTFGAISYSSAFGSSSNGSPIISLRFGANDPSNFIRANSGVQAAPSDISNLMDAAQLYTIYIRGDGTDVYFGVDDPLSAGGVRESILTSDDFPGTTVDRFALGMLLRTSSSFSGNTPVDLQGVYIWDGATDATTRDTLLSEIASGPISSGITLDSDPASMQRGVETNVSVSNASSDSLISSAFTATLGGEALTITSLTNETDGAYTLGITVPTDIALKHSATGYTLTVTEDSVDADSSGTIPLLAETGYHYVDQVDPVANGSTVWDPLSGLPVTGLQYVGQDTTTPGGISITVDDQGYPIFATTTTQDETWYAYSISPDGTYNGPAVPLTYDYVTEEIVETDRYFDNLGALGYTGSLADRQKQYLNAQGYTGGVSTMAKAHLQALGYTGTVTEMMYKKAIAEGYNSIAHMMQYVGLIG